MKRAIIIVVLLLMAHHNGLCADIYATNSTADPGNLICYKSGGIPDATCSDGTDNSDLQAAYTATGVGDTLYIDAQYSYSGTQLDATDNFDLVNGKNVSGLNFSSGLPGFATLNGATFADQTVNASSGVTATMSYVDITGAQSGYRNVSAGAGSTITLSNCKITSGDVGYYVAGILNINRSVIEGNTSYNDISNAAASVVSSNNMYLGNALPIRVLNGDFLSNNDIFIANAAQAIAVSGDNSQNVTINNAVMAGNGYSNGSLAQLANTSANATCAVNNSLLLPNPASGDNALIYSGTWTLTNDIYSSPPKFTHFKRAANYSIVVDDAASADFFDSLYKLADGYGYKIGWAVDAGNMQSSDWAIANAAIANGHYIVSHGTNNYSTMSAAAVQSEVEGNVATILANTGYAVTSLAYPGWAYDSDARDGVAAAGMIGARTRLADGCTEKWSSMEMFITCGENVGTYYCDKGASPASPYTTIGDQIKALVYSRDAYLQYFGASYQLVSHLGTGSPDYDITAWGYVFDAFSELGASIIKYPDQLNYIISNAESSSGVNGALTYIRSESSLGNNWNMKLIPGSDLINAGTTGGAIGFTSTQTDYSGNTYFFTPYDRLNIGADQSYSDAALRPIGRGHILTGVWSGTR